MAVPLTLKVFKGDQLVTTKDYDRDIIKIGRLSSAHLCLDDEKVSRIHSVIEVGPDGALSIIDMGSVEGTFVNGKRVNKGTLAFGDEIKVGNTTIKVEKPARRRPRRRRSRCRRRRTRRSPTRRRPRSCRDAGRAAAPPRRSRAAPARRLPRRRRPPRPPAPAPVAHAPAPDGRRAGAGRRRADRRSRPRPPARARKGSGPLGRRAALHVGRPDGRRATSFTPAPTKAFTVGARRTCDFTWATRKLGGPTFERRARPARHGSTLRFTGKMKGELHRRRAKR